MVVIVFTVGAAVKPAANSLPEDTKEPEPTQPTMEAVQQVKRFWNCGRQNHNAKHRSGCWYT